MRGRDEVDLLYLRESQGLDSRASPSGILRGIKLIIFLKVALSFSLFVSSHTQPPPPPLSSYLSLWFEFENTPTSFLPGKMQAYSTSTDSFITQVTGFFYNPPRSQCLEIMATDLAHFMFFTGPRSRERERKSVRGNIFSVSKLTGPGLSL